VQPPLFFVGCCVRLTQWSKYSTIDVDWRSGCGHDREEPSQVIGFVEESRSWYRNCFLSEWLKWRFKRWRIA
jgi:hypothetical protein